MTQKYNCIPAGYEDELFGEDEDYDDLDSISRTAQNLKITIVPDITSGAGINGEDFDCSLNADLDNWFDSFRLMWNSYNRTPTAHQSLKGILLKDAQPLLLALKLFANCPGCNNLKNKNLASFILETVCELYKQDPGIAANCDDNTRMTVFNFIKTCGIVSLYRCVLEAYELHRIRDILIPKIKELILGHQYKDAAYWAMLLKTTHLFGLYEIIFPLILQDKIFLAEEYLNFEKSLQLVTVQFLDTLLDKQKSVSQHCDAIITKYNYNDVKHDILSYRPMSKLVTRLAKKYKIDAHLTPNLNFSKTCSYMHYLHRKYQDGDMSSDSWRELIRDAANTKALQLDLVNNVATHGYIDEAIYWARYFQIPKDECPGFIQDKFDQNRKSLSDIPNVAESFGNTERTTIFENTAQNMKNKNPFRAQEYLELELPEDCIVLVDQRQIFLQMINYLESQSLIAFDSEWKPSVNSDNAVSLLQLATFERVYLLDCLETAKLTDDLWQLLGRKIFNNLEILKMGFSLKQDLNMLHKSLPALQINLQNCTSYLDLRDLWRRLKYMQIFMLNFSHASCSGESLCALAEMCLGKKLDKSNQCSNWANRPLRRDQIIYAALDAHCLLQIYQFLAELLLRLGLDIEPIIDEVTTAKSGYLFNSKRIHPVANLFDSQTVKLDKELSNDIAKDNKPSKRELSELKFICDGMLLGLAKELRKLGIDCIDITKNDINEYIGLAKSEGRYLLTRDSRYLLFSKELPQKQCIMIPSESSLEQVVNVINYFNIDIKEENLFTRCIQCNCDEFILVSNEEIQLLRFGQIQESIETQRDGDNSQSLSPFEKSLKFLKFTDKIAKTKRTYRGTIIELSRIKRHIFRTKEYIYICDSCGICTWDGAHSIPNSVRKYFATIDPSSDNK